MSIENDLKVLYPNTVKTIITINERNTIKIVREIYSDNGTLNKSQHKYLEKIVFNTSNNSEFSSKEIIVVGGNPAICDNLIIDKTNQNMINYLSNLGYSGYYLINLYSDIAKKYTMLSNTPNSMEQFIVNSITKYNLDFCVVWGTSGIKTKFKPSKTSNLLYSKINSNTLCSVNNRGAACHGSFSTSIVNYQNAKNTSLLWRK